MKLNSAKNAARIIITKESDEPFDIVVVVAYKITAKIRYLVMMTMIPMILQMMMMTIMMISL